MFARAYTHAHLPSARMVLSKYMVIDGTQSLVFPVEYT
jgi:hypothetical protein